MKTTHVLLVLLAVAIIAAASLYLFFQEDPWETGPDPRICAEKDRILTEQEIIDSAMTILIDSQGAARVPDAGKPAYYRSIRELRDSRPYVRFNADWQWEHWKTDRQFRRSLARSGQLYAYYVVIGYRKYPDHDKPIALEGFQIGTCAERIYSTYPTTTALWTDAMYRDALAKLERRAEAQLRTD